MTKKMVDFYHVKGQLNQLFDLLALPVEWIKKEQVDQPWYSAYQTAYLVHNDTQIGIAGIASPDMMDKIGPGHGFIFELNADFILQYQPQKPHFTPLPKFQDVALDVSFLIDFTATVDAVIAAMMQADATIYRVCFVDQYYNESWAGKKSLTMRYFMRDQTKTMTSEQIKGVTAHVVQVIQDLGGQVR